MLLNDLTKGSKWCDSTILTPYLALIFSPQYLAAIIIKKFQGFSYCSVKFTDLYHLIYYSDSGSMVNSIIVYTGFIFLFILMSHCFSNYFSILLRNTFKQICIWILCCINSQIFSLVFRYSNKFSCIFGKITSLF